MDIYCLLFHDYETLDLMGAVEFLARCPDVRLHYVSQFGGLVDSHQGFAVQTTPLDGLSTDSILVVPGGQGTRTLVNDALFLQQLATWVEQASICLSICTGSALLAKVGCLDGKKATTNKKAYAWATSQSSQVHWQKHARWVHDGKFYTSSGVSAGMDMTLGFIADYYGKHIAQEIVNHCEYRWQSDPSLDEFAKIYD